MDFGQLEPIIQANPTERIDLLKQIFGQNVTVEHKGTDSRGSEIYHIFYPTGQGYLWNNYYVVTIRHTIKTTQNQAIPSFEDKSFHVNFCRRPTKLGLTLGAAAAAGTCALIYSGTSFSDLVEAIKEAPNKIAEKLQGTNPK